MYTWCDISDRFPMTFDVDRLQQELQLLTGNDWLEHYDVTLSRGWKSIPLVSRNGELTGPESQRVGEYEEMKRTSISRNLPYFSEVLDSFKCRHGRIRITRLDPGAGIDKHRDVGAEVANLAFRKVRLHIPIVTNDDVYFWVNGEKIKMAPGKLFYVNFSHLHYVRNEGSTPRYHLVLDLEVNGWLLKYFPRWSTYDELNMVLSRMVLPHFWRLRQRKIRAVTKFWSLYNGSRLQRLRHRFFPKKPS